MRLSRVLKKYEGFEELARKLNKNKGKYKERLHKSGSSLKSVENYKDCI